MKPELVVGSKQVVDHSSHGKALILLVAAVQAVKLEAKVPTAMSTLVSSRPGLGRLVCSCCVLYNLTYMKIVVLVAVAILV